MTTQVPARERDHIRPGEPQQRRRIGPSTSAFLTGGCRRRQRTLLLVDRDFGDADIGHFSPARDRKVMRYRRSAIRAQNRYPLLLIAPGPMSSSAHQFPSTRNRDSACRGTHWGPAENAGARI